jgi:hypothetical protein
MVNDFERKFLIRENNRDFANESFLLKFGSVENAIKKISNDGKKIFQGFLPYDIGMTLLKSEGAELDYEPSKLALTSVDQDSFYLDIISDHYSRIQESRQISIKRFADYWKYSYGRRIAKSTLFQRIDEGLLKLHFYNGSRSLLVAEHNSLVLGRDITDNANYYYENMVN